MASKLNPQQRAAAEHYQGPLQVIAGAGTGKTQVITERIAYLIAKHKVAPAEILAITFTEKAAAEMAARVSDTVGQYVLDVKVTTFNALGDEITRRFAYELGLNPQLSLLTQIQQLVWLAQHIDELKLKYYAPISNPEGFLADLAKYFSQLANELVSPAQYKKFAQGLKTGAKDEAERQEAARHLELAGAYGAYQQAKQREGVMDFDDQVGLAVEILSRFANVRAKLQSEIKFILVDEFQDTNSAQSKLIDLLTGKDQNVMVVGDDDQSIYGFRGAAVANILSFKERYPKAKQISLVANYRSGQEILDAAYRLIQANNPDRLEAKYGISKVLKGQFHTKAPQLESFISWDEEAQFIAGDIKRRLKAGAAPAEIAVLLRKNSQAKILERYLAAEGVDYLLIGQTENLYRQAPVTQVLHFLQVVCDPADSPSLYHLLTGPIFKLDPGELRAYASRANRQHIPLEEVLRTNEQVSEAITGFLVQLEHWRQLLPTLSVGQLAYRFLTDTKFLHLLVNAAKDDPALDAQIGYLNQWFRTLAEFERVSNDASAVSYVAALPTLLGAGEQIALEDLPDLYGERVRLLTVHKAKGLEFDIVYLFDLTADTFPARRLPSSLELPAELVASRYLTTGDSHIQEERRLMYVAMTRAKRELIVSFSPDHGGKQAKRPSRFIEEALGVVPSLAGTKLAAANIDQIELFKVAESKSGRAKPGLPPHLLSGKMLTLTAHQVEDYLMCPAEFYLRHILSPPALPNFALAYGTLIHSVIQLFNRRRIDGKAPQLPELMEFLESNWPKEGFVSVGHKARSLAQAKTTVKRFYQREAGSARTPKFIERSFEFEVPEAAVAIRGRFDAIFTDDVTGVEIRDYKTGGASVTSQAKADNRTKDSFQLGVYALAWQQLQGEVPGVVSLDFVDSGYTGRATRTPRQLATVEKKIAQAAGGIRAQNWRPGSSHLFCSHMDYGF